MDPAFRRLQFEVLVGCSWVAAQPEHVRKNAIFRVLTADGDPYFAVTKAMPHVQDAGIYVASAHGTEHGIPFLVTPEVVELVVPVIYPPEE